MIAEFQPERLARFRRNYRDAVARDASKGTLARRFQLADWCVDRWPNEPYMTVFGEWNYHDTLMRKYRREHGFIQYWILSAILSAVISALIDHWLSDNVRLGL